MWIKVQRVFWKWVFKILVFLFVDLKITGKENIPSTDDSPLIVVGNHFSFFEPIIFFTQLPLKLRYMAATEILERQFFNYLFVLYDGIPVWRGQIDRQALKVTQEALQNDEMIVIFPEGGVLPELQERVQSGEQIFADDDDVGGGMASRIPPVLIPARRGIAFIAANTDAKILPIALLGTENIAKNLQFPWKRTKVKMHIGELFGPLMIDGSLRGSAKKARQQELADQIMCHIAELMPEENRGPFENLDALKESSASLTLEHT